MVRLNIPRSLRSGTKKLLHLDNSIVERLLAVLREQQPAVSARKIASQIAPKVSEVKSEDIYEIIDALVGLYSGRAITQLSLPDFAESVVESIEPDLDEEQRKRAKAHLLELLDVRSLTITANALSISSEYEHTLEGVQILTDIRPIFIEGSEEPVAAGIIRTLKVVYHDRTAHKEIFIALDAKDIKDLRNALERAESETRSLKALLQTANVPLLS